MAKNLILWVVIAAVLMSVFNGFGTRAPSAQKLPYSDFLIQVQHPTLPCPSPTTTIALKLKRRPPLTTLATRLI